jgi:hypothetical protein
MKNQIIFMLSFCLLLASGCSVGMAMHGQKEPDLSVVRIGACRSEVELQLGSPKQSVSLEDGQRVDVYEYEFGNEPSAGRAIAHGTLDVLTLGLWEAVGTPVEGFQGEKGRLAVTYNGDDKVVSFKSQK